MEKHRFTGKTKEEAIKEAKIKLEEQDENNLIISEVDTKKTLFSKKVEIEVIEKREVIQFIKDYTYSILKNMGFSVQIEIFNKQETPTFKVYSDNDALLIGREGKNLKALRHIIGQAIKKEINNNLKFVIDVSNYQEKKEKNLVFLAKRIAREVATSKVEVKLDSMNSYERRIIHNALTNNKKVYTESIGEEPNRCVVLKPKED
ncbi:MAG: KH domain-containing protein [Bacilli bacterium]|nr:KH domain-containing protein [Bacilli bacterium]